MADGALRRWLRAVPVKAVGLSFVLGLVGALGHPPFDLWFLTFVAFVAAFVRLARAPSTSEAFWQGLGFGTGYFALALSWIVEPFFVDPLRHGWMAPFAITFLAAGLALFFGFAFWMAKRVHPIGWPVVLTMTLAELMRAYLLTGLPWAMPSYVLVDQRVAQIAGLIGPHGLNLLFFALAGAGAVAFQTRGGTRILAAVIAIGGFAVMLVPMAAPIDGGEDRPVVRLIQPNAPQHQKWDPAYAGIFFERLVRYSRAGDTRPDLIVWPETAVPVWLNNAANTLSIISNSAGDAPVVLGINRAEERRIFNAAILLDEAGQVAQVYDKHHLVPFGEYIPLGDVLGQLGIRGFASRNGEGFSPGPGPAVMDLGGLGKALLLICYEAVFPQDVRGAPERPAFILHITNDAWFGSFSGPYQHLAQARMRAIESGLPVLRAANTGVSAAIDAQGRVLSSLALNTEGYLDAPLPVAKPATLYWKIGDLPVAVVILLLLLVTVLLRQRESD